MKKLLLIMAIVFVATRLMAQHVTITYDATKGATQLVGATSVYIHSGGNDQPVIPVSGSCWHCVIGNWGMDDGVGKMTNIGTDLWQMDLPDAWAYYDAAGACDFTGTTIQCIGMVFRSANGDSAGKDDNNSDIFADLQGPTPVVVNSDGTAFNGVTVTASPVGIGNVGLASSVHCFPNPMNAVGIVSYSLDKPASKITLSVFDVTGKELMQIDRSNQSRGTYQFSFDTQNLANGMYFFSLTVDGNVVSNRFAVTKD